MIRSKETERLQASNYLHVHVIPLDNDELLRKKYKVTEKVMESSWREMIADQSKYIVIDPKSLMTATVSNYSELHEYLGIRYWTHK